MVEAEFLEHVEPFFNGTGISGGSERTERMVVGDTFQEHFTPVKLKSVFRREFYLADSKPFRHAVGDRPVLPENLGCQGV